MEIAIIGVSLSTALSENLVDFYESLNRADKSARFLNDEYLLEKGVDLEQLNNPNYVPFINTLENKEFFDYQFFGYKQQEAKFMCPQTRLLHQEVWKAMEDAGYFPNETNGKTGLFFAANEDILFQVKKQFIDKAPDKINEFYSDLLSNANYAGSLIAYNFDLKGPVIKVETACSSSLVAVQKAVQSLVNGECTMALVAGVFLSSSEELGYIYQSGSVLSSDGHCRPFDHRNSGTIPGEGAGVVLLKSKSAALADKDHIYAVIRGTEVNNDGKRKLGYTTPGSKGQFDCITSCFASSGISPNSLSYIETHGTGTKLGDRTELKTLFNVFEGVDKKIVLGSIKANIGHLNQAAGILGLIKTALIARYKFIPPLANFEELHGDLLNFGSRFVFNTDCQKIQEEKALFRAGVCSYGIGGTNAFAILEEHKAERFTFSNEGRTFCFSSNDLVSLENYLNSFISFLEQSKDINLESLEYTLKARKKHFSQRVMITNCSSKQELINKLKAKEYQSSQIEVRKGLILELDNETPLADLALVLAKYSEEDKFLNWINGQFEGKGWIKLRSLRPSDVEKLSERNSKLLRWMMQLEIIETFKKSGFVLNGIKSSGIAFLLSAYFAEDIDLSTALTCMLVFVNNPLLEIQEFNDILYGINPEVFKVSWIEKNRWFERIIQKKENLNSFDSTLMEVISLRSWMKETERENLGLIHSDNTVSDILERLWLNGIDVDWKVHFQDKNVSHCSTPSYAFKRNSFESTINLAHLYRDQVVTELPENKLSDSLQYYTPYWKQYLYSRKKLDQSNKRIVLLLSDESSLSVKIEQDYQYKGFKVYTIIRRADQIIFDNQSFSAWSELLQTYSQSGLNLDTVISFWQLNGGEFDGLFSLLDFYRGETFGVSTFYYLTRNCFSVVGNEKTMVNLANGGAIVLNQEYPKIQTVQLDICNEDDIDLTAKCIVECCTSNVPDENVLAIRSGRIWQKSFESISLNENNAVKLGKSDVILVTGGGGRIGFELAKYLIEQYAVKLIVVGRSKLEDDPFSETAVRMDLLMNISENVEYISAEIGDYKDFYPKLKSVVGRMGEVTGVIHAAGNTKIDEIFVSAKSVSEMNLDKQIKGKLLGIQTIEQTVNHEQVKFVWVTSSLSSILGGVSYLGYSIANSNMDEYLVNNCPLNWKTVNLDAVNVEREQDGFISRAALFELFEKTAFNTKYQQVIACISSLEDRLMRNMNSKRENQKLSRGLYNNNAPRTDKKIADETKLLQCWRGYFENDKIGKDDDFFELGGTSIDAVTLTTIINDLFQTNFNHFDVYQYSTVSKQLQKINAMKHNEASNTF